MGYKALYRTYRPSTFDEVAGQQHIVQTIKNALLTKKIAHAYLFAGPRGTGKTTMAKLLAKALNCDEGIGEQCNECKNCIAINEGNHPDVLEIDAASNNGVDEIRNIIDKVKYGTILGRYKIYIIDEVHMLTTQAFNALLKTLEEPPEHVVFILATTEPHKIIPTILSRCQRYDFNKVSDNDIRQRIMTILEQENIEYNKDAIDLIISLCDGGMRDALSMLDQVLAYSSNRLDPEDILDIFALESTEEKVALLSSVFSHNIKDVVTRLKNYFNRGTDIKRLTSDLLVILKDILIFQTSHQADLLESLDPVDANTLSSLTNKNDVTTMINTLMTTLNEFQNVTSINPLFEITLLKLAAIDKTIEAPKSQATVKEEPIVEKKQEPVIKEKPVINSPEPSPTIVEEIQPRNNLPLLVLKGCEKDGYYAISDELMIKVMVKCRREMRDSLAAKWNELQKYIAHPVLGKAASILSDSHVLVANEKVMVIESQFQGIVDQSNTTAMQKNFQDITTMIFGKRLFVYSVTRGESLRLQKIYMDSAQLNTLPKKNTFEIEYEGE